MNDAKRKPDGTQPGDDRLQMTSPDLWGSWPLQTIKRRRPPGFPELAVLYERTEGEIVFIQGDAFLVTQEKIDAAPKADIDKLLADGWIID